IKLDFLYAFYNNPKLTTHEADTFLHAFLLRIRQRYPHVYTIACGCPLVPAVGTVNSMRIGPDSIWPAIQHLPLVCQLVNRRFYRQMAASIAARAWTKELWNVDYDAFVCRQHTGISDRKLLAIAAQIKASQGNIFLGDDMTKLPSERFEKFVRPL